MKTFEELSPEEQEEIRLEVRKWAKLDPDWDYSLYVEDRKFYERFHKKND